jgi:thiol-disulfide isomerase/thioredoxin
VAKRSRRSQRAERRAAERAGARGRGDGNVEVSTRGADGSDGPSWTVIGGVLVAVVALVVIAVVALGGGGGGGGGASNITSAEAANQLAIARQNSGGSTISVHQGSAHTVMHADASLPTASAPRPDGRATLVWFSGTWCHFCERMEPFAHETAAQFSGQVVFMEKSVDHDRGAASRYGVRGTPTFVLIDAEGDEISRFFYQDTPTAFGGAIVDALRRAS